MVHAGFVGIVVPLPFYLSWGLANWFGGGGGGNGLEPGLF
jgi:hypothetical protein